MIALLLALALPAAGAVVGGHAHPGAPESELSADQRRATLEEMWQRRLLPPDQRSWGPQDLALLKRIREHEADALELLKRRLGGYRSWTVKSRGGLARLTREGFDKYLFLITQDAIDFFESKGMQAKWTLKLRDEQGRALFDGRGLLTDAGSKVYRRASLNLEAYWVTPAGERHGTRRPAP